MSRCDPSYDIEYTKSGQSSVQEIKNTISLDTLYYCSFYTVYNQKTEERYYTIGLKDEFNGTYLIKYYDIFTGEELKYSNFAFHFVDTLESYLNDEEKEYTKEDLRVILNDFIKKQEKNKQLVKEK